MKQIIELTNNIKDQKYHQDQFVGAQRTRIVFVNPQLSGKDLYRAFLLYFKLHDVHILTAITGTQLYHPLNAKKEAEVSLLTSDIKNATHIVLPFSTQPFVGEGNLYDIIKKINPKAQIFIWIDFNFWEIEEGHPYYEIFDEETKDIVEDNLVFADMILALNMNLLDYLRDKVEYLRETKYKGLDLKTKAAVVPCFIDEAIVLENLNDSLPEVKQVTEEMAEHKS